MRRRDGVIVEVGPSGVGWKPGRAGIPSDKATLCRLSHDISQSYAEKHIVSKFPYQQ